MEEFQLFLPNKWYFNSELKYGNFYYDSQKMCKNIVIEKLNGMQVDAIFNYFKASYSF